MKSNSSNLRCSALTKRGKPCRAAPTEGGLCFFHKNPTKAAELGRIGGRGNRRSVHSPDPLPRLDDPTALRDAVAQLIDNVYQGKLHPRIAAGLAPLLNLQLRTIEAVNFEHRIAVMEKRMASMDKSAMEKGTDPAVGDKAVAEGIVAR